MQFETDHDLSSPTTGTSSSLSADTKDMVTNWFCALGGNNTVEVRFESGTIG
jgi:hypothetical protein